MIKYSKYIFFFFKERFVWHFHMQILQMTYNKVLISVPIVAYNLSKVFLGKALLTSSVLTLNQYA